MTTSKPVALTEEKEPRIAPFAISIKKKDYYSRYQRKVYNTYYRELKGGHKGVPFEILDMAKFIPEPLDGTDMVCVTFGCATKLSHREALFGDKCLSCQQKKGHIDPTLYLKSR
jgi:hypothetical protein